VNRLESFGGRRVSRSLASSSPDRTIELGERMGALLPPGAVISLEGGLGAGKTLLAKGMQEVLDLGLLDVMDGGNIVIVEWGDRLPEGVLRPDIRIMLRITGELEREISIEAPELFLESLQGVTGGTE
jgi:tRNA A37 threonylcarbamoyladenosine biosynthesis protein TsaE